MKTRQENEVTACISVVYAENNIELSWPMGSGADCEEK